MQEKRRGVGICIWSVNNEGQQLYSRSARAAGPQLRELHDLLASMSAI